MIDKEEIDIYETPTLYALDSYGRVIEWNIFVKFEVNLTATIVTTYGLIDGKKQTVEKIISSGKNIGKKNETSTYEQACFEANSKWNSQLDKGYSIKKENLKQPSEEELFLPMLAKKYEDYSSKISYPIFVQPKLDGFRSLAKKQSSVIMWSRRKKKYANLQNIKNALGNILNEGECFDGEIYCHDWKNENGEVNFQRISSAIKKENSDSKKLIYCIYDIPCKNKSFYERFYKPFFIDKKVLNFPLKLVPTIQVNDEDELNDCYQKFLNEGYEGLMIRTFDGDYAFDARSSDLLKMKPFNEEDFLIVGGKEGTGKDQGTVIFTCENSNGIIFESRPMGTLEQRKEFFENLNQYIGKHLKVRFNGYTSDGIPRFNRGVGIREDWDK